MSCQTSSWLSPSHLHSPVVGSHFDISDVQQNIRRGGSTHSLQLDNRMVGGGGDQCQENRTRTFQWERNHSGDWERRKGVVHREDKRRHKVKGLSRDAEAQQVHGDDLQQHDGDSSGDSSSPVYEEYRESSHDQEQDTESLYDTLPPTRRAYEGYPSSPLGLNLHPAQLMPPLRAWDLEADNWGGMEEHQGRPGSGSLSGSGDELERLLNLVSLRARRATRTNRASTGSEPADGWDEFK